MQISAAYPGGRPPGNPRATAGHGIGLFQNVPHETGDLANICFLQINPGDNPPPGYACGAVTWASSDHRLPNKRF